MSEVAIRNVNTNNFQDCIKIINEDIKNYDKIFERVALG